MARLAAIVWACACPRGADVCLRTHNELLLFTLSPCAGVSARRTRRQGSRSSPCVLLLGSALSEALWAAPSSSTRRSVSRSSCVKEERRAKKLSRAANVLPRALYLSQIGALYKLNWLQDAPPSPAGAGAVDRGLCASGDAAKAGGREVVHTNARVCVRLDFWARLCRLLELSVRAVRAQMHSLLVWCGATKKWLQKLSCTAQVVVVSARSSYPQPCNCAAL